MGIASYIINKVLPVQLTGGNEILDYLEDLSVAAGASDTSITLIKAELSKYKKIYVQCIPNTTHTYKIFMQRLIKKNDGTYDWVENVDLIASASQSNKTSSQLDLNTVEAFVSVTNSDISPHTYKILVGGVN